MPRCWTFALAVALLAGGCKRDAREGGAEAKPSVPPVVVGSKAPGAQPTSSQPPRPTASPVSANATDAGRPAPHDHRHEPLAVCQGKGDPLDSARRYYDDGAFAEALSCAAQATAFYPDLPQAHSERGAALSALGRFHDAQLAYARALALAPDHPDALLGAAHLFAVSLPSSREHDELASVYAERGLAVARSQRDSKLAVQFAIVSAMAFNDLGRSAEALARADEVLKQEKGNREAMYERAVALFELCRFIEARAAFAALLDDEDHGAHAHHHLGLLLEREGKWSEAEKHFEQARRLAPEDFPPPQLLSEAEFKTELDRAISELPEDMKRDLVGVPVEAEELPREEDLIGGEPPLSPTILGLFRGPPLGERCDPVPGEPCRSVALYRRNLARAVNTREELLEQIRVTLLHEVGHLRGEDDYELAARGLE